MSHTAQDQHTDSDNPDESPVKLLSLRHNPKDLIFITPNEAQAIGGELGRVASD